MSEDPNRQRMLECPARTSKQTCQIVDMTLGFKNVMKLSECDRCFAADPRSQDAAKLRGQYVDMCVNGLKVVESLRKSSREVIFAMTSRHMTREESAAALSDSGVMHQMNAEILWADAENSFKEAEHFQKGTLLGFLKSMWSRAFEKPVDPEVLALRKKSCFDGPCPSLATAKDGVRHFCASCGCGEKDIAMLDDPKGKGKYTKLMYPRLMCPRKRPGFSNAILTVNGNAR